MKDFSMLPYRRGLRYAPFLLLFYTCGFSADGKVYVETGESKQVYPGKDGKLVYTTDDKGNRLPDFSHVGYHGGEKDIPDAGVKLTLSPKDGDNTRSIQNAIEQLAKEKPGRDGLRGALLLKRGIYRIDGSLQIRESGIVLRGEGHGKDGTVLVAAGYGSKKYKRTLITIGSGQRAKPRAESKRAITDAYVPIGAHTFTVESTDGYQEGDPILLHRPSTAEWIHAIGCDRIKASWTPVTNTEWVKEGKKAGFYYQRGGLSGRTHIKLKEGERWNDFQKRIPLSKDGKKLDTTHQWQAGSYDFYFERRITSLDKKKRRITIDAPVVHALDERYGGGAIYHYETPGRIGEVGIENLRLVSEFAKPVPGYPYGDPKLSTRAEDHGWNGIKLHRNSENTWVRGVTGKYFGWSLVSASGLRATVQDCTNLGHASRISGGRRYPFMIDGQLNLVQRCLTIEGRHEFVVQARTAGPNVFVDCIGQSSKSSSGPHHRYAVGTLFDNVTSQKSMESRNHGSSGTGHGWAGTQTCFYNCVAPKFAVQAPPGGMSWVIGSGKTPEARVQPPSLYYRQLKERLGEKALNRLATEEQRKSVGSYPWAKERLD